MVKQSGNDVEGYGSQKILFPNMRVSMQYSAILSPRHYNIVLRPMTVFAMISRNQKVISQNNRSVNNNSDVPIFLFEFLQIYLFFQHMRGDVGSFEFCSAIQVQSRYRLKTKVSVVRENFLAFTTTLTYNIELGIHMGHGNLQSM